MSMQASGLVHPYIRISGLFPVDISAYPGTALAICGSNGAGKTTFLKLLLKEIEPKKGTVRIDAQFTYLGIKNGLKPQLTVQQQLSYFMSTQLDFPWPEFLHIAYKDLSTGQQRLVALWLTLHSSKLLIFLDEPFSHLDSLACSQAYMWINAQLNLKKTIVFTHHCSEGLHEIGSLQVFDLNGY